jgi:hypothetical protein
VTAGVVAAPREEGPTGWSAGACLLLAGLGGLAIGILTSFCQTWLPAELHSLANSAGSWSAAAFLLALPNRSPRLGIVLGPLALAAMLAGYALATFVRGFPMSTSTVVFWTLAAVVVGPVLGVGAAWARGGDPWRVALGAAPLTGILLGEAAYGLTVIADTTSPVYWVVQGVAGAACLLAVAIRTRAVGPTALAVVIAAALAIAFVGVYSGDLLALLPI